jgi:hypothetical protein
VIAAEVLMTQDRNCVTNNQCSVIVYYDTNPADNPAGCGQSNCRAMNGVQAD